MGGETNANGKTAVVVFPFRVPGKTARQRGHVLILVGSCFTHESRQWTHV